VLLDRIPHETTGLSKPKEQRDKYTHPLERRLVRCRRTAFAPRAWQAFIRSLAHPHFLVHARPTCLSLSRERDRLHPTERFSLSYCSIISNARPLYDNRIRFEPFAKTLFEPVPSTSAFALSIWLIIIAHRRPSLPTGNPTLHLITD